MNATSTRTAGRESDPSRISDLRCRASALRQEIAATERKRRGIDEALSTRRLSLQRLEARLVLLEDAVGLGLHDDVS
jgi:hypothetical protein